jgi:hypothetical protein
VISGSSGRRMDIRVNLNGTPEGKLVADADHRTSLKLEHGYPFVMQPWIP